MVRWLAAALVLAACHHAPPPRVAIEVEVTWPGESAEELATAVVAPLERALGQMPHIVASSSVSHEGRAVIHVEVEGERDRVLADLQAALTASARSLPAALPTPPLAHVVERVVGRYLVPIENARAAIDVMERRAGVAGVDTCGLVTRQQEIVADPQTLGNMGITVAEVVAAVRAAPGPISGELAVLRENGMVIRLKDVAQVRDQIAPPACAFAPRGQVELIVHGREPLGGIPLVPAPRAPELHGSLDPALMPEAALDRVATAIGSGATAEIRRNELVVRGATREQLQAVTGLVDLGQATATVHVTGGNAQQVAEAARAIAARLRSAGLLVTTHGLATSMTLRYEVDRDRAERLGVTNAAVAETLAAMYGLTIATSLTKADAIPVVLRVGDTNLDHVMVRAGTASEVPMSSLVRAGSLATPLEVLHRRALPDIDLEVHGDAATAIGPVPAGVRVEID